MTKRRNVTLGQVDEGFFNTFEIARQKEQGRLRKKFGNTFNLTQKNFTAILNAKKFKFVIPKQKRNANNSMPINGLLRRPIRRGRRKLI